MTSKARNLVLTKSQAACLIAQATNLNRPAVTQRRVYEGDRLMAGLETSRETAQIEDMVLCSACSPQASNHPSHRASSSPEILEPIR